MAPLVHTEILENWLAISSNTLSGGGAVVWHNDFIQLKSHKQEEKMINQTPYFAVICTLLRSFDTADHDEYIVYNDGIIDVYVGK